MNCELAAEFAKDLTWEKRHKTLDDQIYIFGKQYHRIYRLLEEVDVIITDSPILLTPIYDKYHRESLKILALEEHNKLNNLNVFLQRKKKYNLKGRNQSEKQAVEIDKKIKNFLEEYNISFIIQEGTPIGVANILNHILNNYYGIYN